MDERDFEGTLVLEDERARSLLAGAFAVAAPRPAAGPTQAFL
jgi:hypothetical protein